MRFIKRHLWAFIVTLTLIGCIWEIRMMMREEQISVASSDYQDPTANQLVVEENGKRLPDKMMLTVHLDLKGAPPNLQYLKSLLPKMARAGCDSLLVEYEDMFPYKGSLVNLSATNHYSPGQIRELISWAHDLGMQVIPLVQTFGHLESALKLQEWAHLREHHRFPSELCPSKSESFSLVTKMITQVMAYHKSSRYIHIGCDEVFHIGLCPKCRQRSLSPRALFEDHVIRVAKWIKERFPKVEPIIWDDMMRKWSPEEVIHSDLGNHVIPMVWVYTGDVLRAIQSKWWLYSKTFQKIWVAGAFKGAGQPRSDFPYVEKRLANQQSWLDLIHRSQTTHNVVGLVLTGWSRFDHFAVLCELLPVSVPSLYLNLLYVKAHMGEDATKKNQLVYKDWQEMLDCPGRLIPERMDTVEGRSMLGECNWAGADLYRSLVVYRALKSRVKEIEHLLSERHGWVTRYNVLHNFTNPARIIDELVELGISSNLQQVEKIKVEMFQQISWYTNEFTAREWIEDRILPVTSSLVSMNRIMDALLARTHWPRRPLEENIPILV